MKKLEQRSYAYWSNGEKQGLVAFSVALESARQQLDLVQVSPSDANPVVCKLIRLWQTCL
jgi:translation initiation factor IF-3